MAKTATTRLDDVDSFLIGFDDDGAYKVDATSFSNLVLLDLKDRLANMSAGSKKKLGETLHLGSKKDKEWRKFVRALLLLENVMVIPHNRRTKAAVISASVPKTPYQLRADLKDMIKALDPWPNYGTADLAVVRPVKIGCSISGGDATGPGSIGCFVRDRATGKMMLLTNQHVALQEFGNDMSHGNPDIRQPAKLNGGQPTNKIGVYARGFLDGNMDAAVCFLSPGIAWSNETRACALQPSIPITGTNANFAKDDYVWKCGCMSFISRGRIEDPDKLNSTVPHNPKLGGSVTFVNQIEVKSVNNRQFQIPGDSGSCLVNQNNEIIGLLHGGTMGGAIATPIGDVLNRLKVDFVAGGGVAT
jgi:hypothetical protein